MTTDNDLYLLSILVGAEAVNSLHRTTTDAEAALFAYVKGNWAEEMSSEPMPKSKTSAIADYFDPEGGVGERESYIIEKLSVPEAKARSGGWHGPDGPSLRRGYETK